MPETVEVKYVDHPVDTRISNLALAGANIVPVPARWVVPPIWPPRQSLELTIARLDIAIANVRRFL